MSSEEEMTDNIGFAESGGDHFIIKIDCISKTDIVDILLKLKEHNIHVSYNARITDSVQPRAKKRRKLILHFFEHKDFESITTKDLFRQLRRAKLAVGSIGYKAFTRDLDYLWLNDDLCKETIVGGSQGKYNIWSLNKKKVRSE